MDELCLDRKDALKFYENPDQWAHVKSDRKIYCTKKGNGKTFFNHIFNRRYLYCKNT